MKKVLLYFSLILPIFSEGIKINVDMAMLNGVGHEYVYKNSQGVKLSELIWNIQSVPLIGVGLNYGEEKNYSLGLNFYGSYSSTRSDMDDYDWVLNSSDWTHWSNSPTDNKGIYKLDLKGKYKIQTNNFQWALLAGVKYDQYKWATDGGTYIYSDDNGSHFRQYSGNLPDGVGISYNQYFLIPYIGVGSEISLNRLMLKGELIYSGMVKSHDEDTHYLRDLYFEDIFENGTYYGLNISGIFKLSDNFSINGNYSFDENITNKGYTKTTDLTDMTTSVSSMGTAGIANQTSTISLGLSYTY